MNDIILYFAVGVYLAGALYTFRFVAGRVAWVYGSYPDGTDVFGGFFAGAFAALVWPLTLTFLGTMELARHRGVTFREFMVERVFRVPSDKRARISR